MNSFLKTTLPLLLVSVFLLPACQPSQQTTTEAPASDGREFYQLKVYTFENEAQVSATDEYLSQALLPALKRQGLGPIGVFKLRPSETDASLQTYVLIPFTSIDQFLAIEANLAQDKAYQTAGSKYINAPHDQAPYQRIESSILQAFTDMPQMQASAVEGPKSERVYELRSYESATEKLYVNKVDMFNAGGEIKLFDRLGFNAVFYAEVLSGSKMPNLMYMTTFADQQTRDTLWKEFFASPEWTDLKANPNYQNNVSHADIIFLYPTDYSAY